MYLFYSPQINTPFHTFNEEESKHCINVLRLTNGSIVYIIDGKGAFCKARIIDSHPKRCKIEVIEISTGYNKHNYYLHVAIAPTKNIDRFEWFVEKAVEIGVDEITPLLCEHSERKVIKLDRTEKVAIAAMKQSLKAYLPKINEIVEFSTFIKNSTDANKLIAHCAEHEKVLLQHAVQPKQNVLIVIGPEGDFSATEIELAITNNYQAVSLGNSRLRTETAGVVSCCTIAVVNN